MSYINKERAKECECCGRTGTISIRHPRPCPKCQYHLYGHKQEYRMSSAAELINKIQRIEHDLEALKEELERIQGACEHKKWTDPVWHTSWLQLNKDCWTRECYDCGLVQCTTVARETTVLKPVFPVLDRKDNL